MLSITADASQRAPSPANKIATLAAAGKVGLDEANDLAGLQKSYIEAKIGTDAEAQLAALKRALRDHPNLAFDLTVIGGMSDLPGTNITMPPRTLAVTADRDRGASGDDAGDPAP